MTVGSGPGPADKPPAAGERHSNLYLRVVSALVLAPLVLAAAWVGGWIYLLMVIAAALLVYHEWCRMMAVRGALAVAGAAGLLATAAFLAWGEEALAIAVCLAAAAGCAAIAIFNRDRAWAGLGVGYAGLPMVALGALREGEHGLWVLALVLALTWATDVAAYAAGRSFGGPKLWPSVSPKKTWSGALGGLLGGALAGLAVAMVGGVGTPWVIALVAAVLSIAAQAGDLAESALKRHAGVKDSGTLIPGHGGIMDRVDGLVAAATGAYLIGLAASAGGDASQGLAWL